MKNFLELVPEAISHDEAHEMVQRFIHSHFRNSFAKGKERARFSIPVDFKRDDDVRLQAYIDQQAAKDAVLAVAKRLLQMWLSEHKYGVCPSCGVSPRTSHETRVFLMGDKS